MMRSSSSKKASIAGMRTQPVPVAPARRGSSVCCRAPCGGILVARPHGIPGSQAELGVPRGMVRALQSVWRDVGFLEVGHRIAAGFEEQDGVFHVGNPVFPKRARMRRRSGSAYISRLGSGSGTINRPIALGESGPCCQTIPLFPSFFLLITRYSSPVPCSTQLLLSGSENFAKLA
jgi:hypothetical protein